MGLFYIAFGLLALSLIISVAGRVIAQKNEERGLAELGTRNAESDGIRDMPGGHKIAGITNHVKDTTLVGVMEGVAGRIHDNPHDRYAVGIWKEKKFVGYIPMDESKDVSEALDKFGGTARCAGFIRTFVKEEDGSIMPFGRVWIKGVDSEYEDIVKASKPL